MAAEGETFRLARRAAEHASGQQHDCVALAFSTLLEIPEPDVQFAHGFIDGRQYLHRLSPEYIEIRLDIQLPADAVSQRIELHCHLAHSVLGKRRVLLLGFDGRYLSLLL